ncbi:MAG: TonB-dependent receptor [candidate division KSB1 bacterium]|nr:TonB-dependent receptor [candidate division KSB1 bacterium]
MMGHAISDAYPLEGLERIEVVRGPASFLYGTNAMGGVINLVTRDVDQPGFETGIAVGAGSFDTRNLSIRHGGKAGNFNYHLSGGLRATDGHRDNSDFDGNHMTAHMGYEFSEKTRLEINANYSDIYLLDPGTETEPYREEKHWYQLYRSGADLTIDHESGLGRSVLKLHGNFGRHRIFDGWRSNDQTLGVMFYHNMELWRGNTTTAGLDYKQYGGDAEDTINKVPYIQYDEKFMREYAPYVHMQQLLYHRFILSAGLRMEQHELYGSQVLPKLGLVSHLTSNTSVRVSASKGFRSPAIRELYVFPPRNKDLKPEEMWNSEFGIRHRIGDRAVLEGVVFRAKGSNMIRMNFIGGKPQFQNSGDFVHTGYELSAHWLPLNDLQVTASWSDMDLKDETRGYPERKLTLNAGYVYNIARFSVSLLHARDLFGSDGRQDPLPDYTIVNTSASVQICKSVSLALHLKNVLDSSYQTLLGYPMPGRRLLTRLNYSF